MRIEQRRNRMPVAAHDVRDRNRERVSRVGLVAGESSFEGEGGQMSGSFRLLVTIGAVVLVAWVAGSAGARQLAGIYNVHPLVSDSAAVQAPAVDASLVNGWGLSAGPTTPWWTSNNGIQHLDLVQRGRGEVGTDGDGCGSTDRHGVQWQCHGFRRQPKRQERCGAVPVRNGGRHHHGVVAWSQRDSRSDSR